MIHQPLDAFTVGSIYIEKKDQKFEALCGNCLLPCGIIYEHNEQKIVALTNFCLTVDYPLEVIRFCQRQQFTNEVHKHHYLYRIASIAHGKESNESMFENINPAIYTKNFFGAAFSTPCQVVSPCLMGHKCDFGCNNVFQKLIDEKVIPRRVYTRKRVFPDRFILSLNDMTTGGSVT